MAGVVINTGSRIGRFAIVNTGATDDHDNLFPDYRLSSAKGTNQEHAAVSASLNDGAQQGPVSKGPQ
jgi:hypothetical protein